jgi:superfamily I DNA/RNA helicase
MTTWLVPTTELTTEQLRAIELDASEHRVIMGGPGSGKTMVLLHRARHLRHAGGVPPERFHIFVFTNVLSTYIKSALDLLEIPETCVSTFDDWCRRFYEAHISKRVPWDKLAKRPDFPAIRAGVLKHVTAQKSSTPLFDFVLVDEGQDLDASCFELLTRAARHVTVCMDQQQQIYEGGSSDAQVLTTLGLKRRNITLLETFRCCPYIVQLASQYIIDDATRAAYLQQTKTAQTDIETPLLYRAADFEDERDKLIEIVKLRVSKGERVGILLPLQRQVHGFGQGLREAGVDVEIQGKDLDFATDLPKIMTYHSAKGLTFDTVLLPRLTENSFPKFTTARIERLMFVGLTRAVRWVYLSTAEAKPFEPLARLEPLAAAKKLTILTRSGGATSDHVAEPNDDGLDFL